eukprot:scaffold105764_cov34-Phaeocystis_antarctica.AAC.2
MTWPSTHVPNLSCERVGSSHVSTSGTSHRGWAKGQRTSTSWCRCETCRMSNGCGGAGGGASFPLQRVGQPCTVSRGPAAAMRKQASARARDFRARVAGTRAHHHKLGIKIVNSLVQLDHDEIGVHCKKRHAQGVCVGTVGSSRTGRPTLAVVVLVDL